jgi:hypothetical protein
MRIIPLANIPAQTLKVILGRQDCAVSVYWRQGRIYLDLDVGATAVCRGAICQNRADVLQSKNPVFAGTLHFFDLEGDRPPQWDRLSNGQAGRWVFVYIEPGEDLPPRLRH